MSEKWFGSNLMSSHSAPRFPTVKVRHFEQHTDLAVLLYQPLKLRHEVFVILMYKFTADLNFKNFSTILLC